MTKLSTLKGRGTGKGLIARIGGLYDTISALGGTLNIDGDSGSSSVILASQRLNINGTANQVVTVANAQTVTLSLPQNIHTGASPTFNDLTLSAPSNIYSLSHDSFADFVANEHINHTSVTLTAGAGLTGGGDISANRTFNIGAGTGITVNADSIEVDFSAVATAAHLHDGQTLQLDGINSDGGAFAFTTTGRVTYNQGITIGTPSGSPNELLHLAESAPEIHLESTGGGVTWALHSTTSGTLRIQDESSPFIALDIAKTTGSVSVYSLAASQAVFTNASRELISVDITGDTKVAMSNNPTFTGTVSVASLSASSQITSTLATGTAPLSVTSTTVCTNLNADLWDGNEFATYLNQAVRDNSSPTFTRIYCSTYDSKPSTNLDIRMNGDIKIKVRTSDYQLYNNEIYRSVSDDYLSIYGGAATGGHIKIHGNSHATRPYYIDFLYGGSTLRAMINYYMLKVYVDAEIDGVIRNSGIKSGATQAASGAAADEIWKTASHATLPDNVLMIGI